MIDTVSLSTYTYYETCDKIQTPSWHTSNVCHFNHSDSRRPKDNKSKNEWINTRKSTLQHLYPELSGVRSPTCSTVSECVCVCEKSSSIQSTSAHSNYQTWLPLHKQKQILAVLRRDRNMGFFFSLSLSLASLFFFFPSFCRPWKSAWSLCSRQMKDSS